MDAGRILYLKPKTVPTKIMVLIDGNRVLMFSIRKAATDRSADYENIYAVFCEVTEGKIAPHVEVLDSAVAEKAFDLSAIQEMR